MEREVKLYRVIDHQRIISIKNYSVNCLFVSCKEPRIKPQKKMFCTFMILSIYKLFSVCFCSPEITKCRLNYNYVLVDFPKHVQRNVHRKHVRHYRSLGLNKIKYCKLLNQLLSIIYFDSKMSYLTTSGKHEFNCKWFWLQLKNSTSNHLFNFLLFNFNSFNYLLFISLLFVSLQAVHFIINNWKIYINRIKLFWKNSVSREGEDTCYSY